MSAWALPYVAGRFAWSRLKGSNARAGLVPPPRCQPIDKLLDLGRLVEDRCGTELLATLAHGVGGVVREDDPLRRAFIAGDVLQHAQAAAGLQEDVHDGDVAGLGPGVEHVEGGLRFYAAAPLTLSTGRAIGVLCVQDTQPHQVDPDKLQQLQFMSDQVVATLEVRKLAPEFPRRAGEAPE